MGCGEKTNDDNLMEIKVILMSNFVCKMIAQRPSVHGGEALKCKLQEQVITPCPAPGMADPGNGGPVPPPLPQ